MLEEYRRKRKFDRTPEPKGGSIFGGVGIFVVHKHSARKLHYDLRLEMQGALRSWAVPKEPPLEAGTKRLAVQVEDHALEYADFEGTIPEGMYGAGRVEIWDKGSYNPVEIQKDKIVVELRGRKLRGKYALVRFRGDKNWLFFKGKE